MRGAYLSRDQEPVIYFFSKLFPDGNLFGKLH